MYEALCNVRLMLLLTVMSMSHLVCHVNQPFPARVVSCKFYNVGNNPRHHEDSQTHSVSRIAPMIATCGKGLVISLLCNERETTTFTGPLAGVETLNIRVMKPELFLVYLAGDHAGTLRSCHLPQLQQLLKQI